MLITISSCKEFTFPTFRSGKDLLAKVDGRSLYLDQVEGIFTEDMSREDSIMILEAHIDRWVTKQLDISEAEKLFQKDEKDIQELLDNYYNSLLIHKYEEHLASRIDTAVVMSDILEYYAVNRNYFRLSSSIVKAKILILPSDYKSQDKLRELFVSRKPESIFDLMDITLRNDFIYEDYTSSWRHFNDIIKRIPFTTQSVDKFLKSHDYYEVDDGTNRYMMYIDSYRTSGDFAPLEMVESSIRKAININRRSQMLDVTRDSISSQLKQENKIEIRKDMLESILTNSYN